MCDGADNPLMMSASTAFSSAKQNWHREPTSGTHRLVPHGVELIAVVTRCALGCLLIPSWPARPRCLLRTRGSYRLPRTASHSLAKRRSVLSVMMSKSWS